MKTVLIVMMFGSVAFSTVNDLEESTLLGLSPDGTRFAILYKSWDNGPNSDCCYSIKVYQTNTMNVEKDYPLGSLPSGSDANCNKDQDFTQHLTDARKVLTGLGIMEGIKPKPKLENGTEQYRVNLTLWLDFTADYPRQTYSLQFHDGSLSVRGKGLVERNDYDESLWREYRIQAVQFSQDLSHCVAVVRRFNGIDGCYQKDDIYNFKAK